MPLSRAHSLNCDDVAKVTRDPQLVILQATPFCNVDCRYCYLPDRANPRRMPRDVAERIFHAVFRSELIEDPILFLWHAGEPLAASTGYFRDMFSLADDVNRSFSRKYRHGIQTNGILIDDEWAALFRDRGVKVGLSLDGPAFIHDRHRVTRSGQGTHAKVMGAVSLLKRYGVEFSIIAVLTRYSLDFPDEMFCFFRDNGIKNVGFNIDETEGVHTSSSFNAANSISQYKNFMRRFMQRCYESRGAITVREFAQIVPTCISPNESLSEPICSTNIPLSVLTFDTEGNFSTFCPELSGTKSVKYADFVMGNIFRDPIESIFHNPAFQLVNHEVQEGVKACKATCAYWNVCGGGFPSNKFFEHGRFDVTETLACRVHKQATVDVVLEYLETELIPEKLIEASPPSLQKSPDGVLVLDPIPLTDLGRPRFMLSRGTVPPGAQGLSSGSYRSDAIIPGLPWRDPSPTELDILRGKTAPWGSWIQVVRVPDEFLTHFDQLRCAARAGNSEGDVTRLSGSPDVSKGINLVTKFLTFWSAGAGSSLERALIQFKPPSLATTTLDQKNNQYIGLHVDTWYSNPLPDRAGSPGRICINLGLEDRYFLYINVSLSRMPDMLTQAGHDELRHCDPGGALGTAFFRAFPNYPVVRIRIAPGEAYIAPTENLLHDGSTEGQSGWDLTLTLRGRFTSQRALTNPNASHNDGRAN
jgi:uncharacterized protein